jgi:hypothetical protein
VDCFAEFLRLLRIAPAEHFRNFSDESLVDCRREVLRRAEQKRGKQFPPEPANGLGVVFV